MSDRQTGTVKFFYSTKGYGFITSQDGSTDFFVHYKDIQMDGFKNIEVGQTVTFVVKKGTKGDLATEVQPG